MSHLLFVLRSAWWHRWRHAWIAAGVTVATAVLTGSLLVGASIRESLQRQALARLGTTALVLPAGERLFSAALADRLRGALDATPAPRAKRAAGSLPDWVVAAALQTTGTLSVPSSGRTAHQVQVLGIDSWFLMLYDGSAFTQPPLAEDETLAGTDLAARLGLQPGDSLVIRIPSPSGIPLEAPLGAQAPGRETVALRATLRGTVASDGPGGFSLRVGAAAPDTVLVSRDWLAQKLGRPGQANLLCVGGTAAASASAPGFVRQVQDLSSLADLQLELRSLPELGLHELRSDRVFLEPQTAAAALASGTGAQGVFTYFVNSVEVGDLRTPYSFVSAPPPADAPQDLEDNEILLSGWLAEDLAAGPLASVTLEFYAMGAQGLLETRYATFAVRGTIPQERAAAERERLPAFPGLSDAANCRDWNPGIPLDMTRIRPRDEAYWKDYRGTPKAFVSLRAAQRLWGNRYGNLTAVRWPVAANDRDTLAADLRQKAAAAAPFAAVPVRDQARRGISQGVSFSGLFIGLSFFIVAAALILTVLLLGFSVEARTEEIGTLLALGFTRRAIAGLLLGEYALGSLVGVLAGTAAGVGYTKLVLWGLAGIWQGALGDAVGGLRLVLHAEALWGGAGAGFAAANLTIAGALVILTRRAVTALQRGTDVSATAGPPRATRAPAVAAALCAAAAAMLCVTSEPRRGMEAAGAFMGAGALLLAAFGLLSHIGLRRLRRGDTTARLPCLPVANLSRRPGRTLATALLLAAGLFLVVSVGANRPAALRTDRASGTGGFALYGESSVPVPGLLQRFFPSQPGVTVFGLRLRQGDDASCLNLLRAQTPRLLGVPARALDQRGAFTFAKTAPGVDPRHAWQALAVTVAGSHPEIPAVADMNVITWGLGKKIGDRLEMRDEAGSPFTLRLVGGLQNSILQGSVLIDEAAFRSLYPSLGGARILLLDAPAAAVENLLREPPPGLARFGVDFSRTTDRLNAFNRVESTYLSIFFALGSFGLLLGTLGLGILLLRNAQERQPETALFAAVGFRAAELRALVWQEHALLLAGGTAAGTAAALVGMIPALASGAGAVSWATVGLLVGAILFCGILALLGAARAVTPRDLCAPLREL